MCGIISVGSFLALLVPLCGFAQVSKKAQSFPWAPEVRCQLNPSRPQGLNPGAYSALQAIAVAHRITQGMNDSSDRGNVHQADATINGKPYTAAVDISVRCLT